MTNRSTLLLFTLILSCTSAARAQASAVATDTTNIIQREDSVGTARDSSDRMSTPSLVGTYGYRLDTASVIAREHLRWLEYRSLSGILEQYAGVFVRNQFSEGQYNQPSIRGTDWRGIAVTMDGRLMNDPASGIYNLYYFSTEYTDRIEIITGPRAFLYGLNGTGGAINLVTRNYNSNKPFSRLNYSESGYNSSYTDGTFSQNISRKINVTLGFQQQSTDGRFENSAHGQWNARVKLRYNVTKDLNIILSDYFTRTQTELNGGVKFSATGFTGSFDPLLATMVNTDSYEKVARHDVDLSLVGTFLEDSASVSLLTLYYSSGFREYRDEENRPNPNGVYIRSDHTSSWMGGLFRQNFETGVQRFNLGANLELRQIEGSPNLGRRRNVIGSVWGLDEFSISDRITLAGYARYDNYLKKSYVGIGADATVVLGDGLKAFGGVSSSRRVPTYQELYWSDSTVGRSSALSAERHLRGELGININVLPVLSARVASFCVRVDDPIRIAHVTNSTVFPSLQFIQTDAMTFTGIDASAALRIGWLHLDGIGMLLVETDKQEYPEFSASGGLYFWDKLVQGHLDLKIGLHGRYFSGNNGAAFNPEVIAYVSDAGTVVGRGGSLDFQATARIGDAYIQLIWENLTNARYFSTPYYPVLDREIRFGISWQFLD